MSNRIVSIDAARCTGCGACIDMCPEGAIHLEESVAVIDTALCSACLACVGACNVEAIVVTETVALAERPETRVQPNAPRSRTIGTALASLGGAALAYVADRVLPGLIDRLTAEKTPEQSGTQIQNDTASAPNSRQTERGGRGRRRRRHGR